MYTLCAYHTTVLLVSIHSCLELRRVFDTEPQRTGAGSCCFCCNIGTSGGDENTIVDSVTRTAERSAGYSDAAMSASTAVRIEVSPSVAPLPFIELLLLLLLLFIT